MLGSAYLRLSSSLPVLIICTSLGVFENETGENIVLADGTSRPQPLFFVWHCPSCAFGLLFVLAGPRSAIVQHYALNNLWLWHALYHVLANTACPPFAGTWRLGRSRRSHGLKT